MKKNPSERERGRELENISLLNRFRRRWLIFFKGWCCGSGGGGGDDDGDAAVTGAGAGADVFVCFIFYQFVSITMILLVSSSPHPSFQSNNNSRSYNKCFLFHQLIIDVHFINPKYKFQINSSFIFRQYIAWTCLCVCVCGVCCACNLTLRRYICYVHLCKKINRKKLNFRLLLHLIQKVMLLHETYCGRIHIHKHTQALGVCVRVWRITV